MPLYLISSINVKIIMEGLFMEHADLGIGLGIDSCSGRILQEVPKDPILPQ